MYDRSLESRVFLVFGGGSSMLRGKASLTSEAGDDSSEAEGCELGVPGRRRGGDLLRIAWIGSMRRSPMVAGTPRYVMDGFENDLGV